MASVFVSMGKIQKFNFWYNIFDGAVAFLQSKFHLLAQKLQLSPLLLGSTVYPVQEHGTRIWSTNNLFSCNTCEGKKQYRIYYYTSLMTQAISSCEFTSLAEDLYKYKKQLNELKKYVWMVGPKSIQTIEGIITDKIHPHI